MPFFMSNLIICTSLLKKILNSTYKHKLPFHFEGLTDLGGICRIAMSFSFRNCTVSKSFAHRRKVKTLAVKNPTCSTWHCSVCLAFALFIVPLIQEWKYRKKRKVRHSFGPSNHIFVTAMYQSIFCKKTFSSLSTCFYGSALLMIKMCTKGSWRGGKMYD